MKRAKTLSKQELNRVLAVVAANRNADRNRIVILLEISYGKFPLSANSEPQKTKCIRPLFPDSDPCLFYQSISKLATHDGSMMYSSASPDIAVTM
jgi:hypothetical protein